MDGSISLCFDGAARQMVAPFCLVQSQSPVLPPTARGFSFGTVPNTPSRLLKKSGTIAYEA